jgi:hypothetical protein
MKLSNHTRTRLEMQGFVGLSDETLAEVRPWLRLAPAVCMIWTVVASALASPIMIWALTPLAALGAALPWHPFDFVYNHGIRRLTGGNLLPRYRAPRRFACLVATMWLALTGLAFYGGFTMTGYALGFSLALAALAPVTTDFCIPSFIYGLLFGKPMACEAKSTE